MDLPEPPPVVAPPGCRIAERTDADAIARLHLMALELIAELRGGNVLVALRRRGHDPDEIGESILADVDSPRRLVLSGCLGDVVVGYAVIDPPAPDVPRTEAVIEEMFVEPDARGVGVGGLLLAAASAAATDRGATGIEAIALPGDRNTKNFFEDHAMVARAIVVHTALGSDD